MSLCLFEAALNMNLSTTLKCYDFLFTLESQRGCARLKENE